MYVFLSESAREREAARVLGGVCRTELGGAAEAAEVLVLPIPLTRDGETVTAVTEGGAPCTLASLRRWLCDRAQAQVIAYAPHPVLAGLPVAYLERDEVFMTENARITAEGGVSLLLSSLGGASLSDFRVVLLGYGRIARALLPMLAPLSHALTVYARRASALRSARGGGYTALPFSSLCENASRRSACRRTLLINTVPDASALSRALDALSPELLLELACTKDVTAACRAREGACVVLCGASMPTRYAPISAGRVLADACGRILAVASLRSHPSKVTAAERFSHPSDHFFR